MKSKIYIIGYIPDIIDKKCQEKFYRKEIQLLNMGYDVINPVERLTNKYKSFEDAKKENLHDLMFASAVYILPCARFVRNVKNLEIKLALDFNLTVVIGNVDFTSELAG